MASPTTSSTKTFVIWQNLEPSHWSKTLKKKYGHESGGLDRIPGVSPALDASFVLIFSFLGGEFKKEYLPFYEPVAEVCVERMVRE